jgi:hypothetical protein
MVLPLLVIPAKAGIQRLCFSFPSQDQSHWIPAFAGMTSKKIKRRHRIAAPQHAFRLTARRPAVTSGAP